MSMSQYFGHSYGLYYVVMAMSLSQYFGFWPRGDNGQYWQQTEMFKPCAEVRLEVYGRVCEYVYGCDYRHVLKCVRACICMCTCMWVVMHHRVAV